MPKMTDEFVNKIFLLEGANIYTEDPDDKGGATKEGITLATWQAMGYDKNHDGHIDKEDIRILDKNDLKLVMEKFWDTIKADCLYNQSIAEFWFDWLWGSGTIAIMKMQSLVAVPADGIVGPRTIVAINNFGDQELLFEGLQRKRLLFVKTITDIDHTQAKWLQGWINRINSFKFSPNQ